MAIPKHKTRTPREAPIRIAPEPPTELVPGLKEPPPEGDPPDQGSRIALAAWLLAFVLLGSLVLWDLITALLFR